MSSSARTDHPEDDTAPRLHFGVAVRQGPKHGLRINRDTYALVNKRSSLGLHREDVPAAYWSARARNFEDEDQRIYTDEFCSRHREAALRNFDRNMAYFASLDQVEFERAVASLQLQFPRLDEVTDLTKWDGSSGLYVMILDDYRQLYVGVATGFGGVMGRIRSHWSKSKPFDRLIWGSEEDSILSIDSFRVLDTTRIFATRSGSPYALETEVVEAVPTKFVLNRVVGGRIAPAVALLGVDAVAKKREMPVPGGR